jgi:ATP-binding cassette, subfamily C, bacterial CydCD
LSGGQAQRLALARAFLKDAPLLVMDEPTAHLDPEQESLLEEAVRRLCERRRVLLIAHRLPTIYRSDRILFVSDGRIVESGTHSELYRQGGLLSPGAYLSGAKHMRLIWRLLVLLRPFAGWIALSVLLGSATIAAGIGLLGTSAFLIARAAEQPSIAVLQVAIVGVRFFGITRGVFRYLERLVSHSVNFRLLSRLRVAIYKCFRTAGASPPPNTAQR